MIQLTSTGSWLCDRHEGGDRPWCEHIQELIEKGEDSVEYHLGQSLEVPIFPSKDIWVTVVIDKEPVVARSAVMRMEYQPEIGSLRKIEMGLWNPGEGMASMRTVVVDYIRSRISPNETLTEGPFKTACPNGAHGLPQLKKMEQNCRKPGWKWECLWNIVMEGACTPCIEYAQNPSDDNFGIDASILEKPRWK
jgi:hypothetical protein